MKAKVQIKSILAEVAPQVFVMKQVNEAKTYITKFLSDRNIKEEDKKVILSNINKCNTIYSVHKYICNSLLMYEGHGVNSKI
jgi:F0F1-type ATP synthase delta subunit